MEEKQPGPGHSHLPSPLQLQMCGVLGCGQGNRLAKVQGLRFHVPDPDQQQDEDHRSKQEPEETQDVEAQGEETAKVGVEKRVVSGAIHIPLSQSSDLFGIEKVRDDCCGF